MELWTASRDTSRKHPQLEPFLPHEDRFEAKLSGGNPCP